jgi:hypothetical protein
MSTKARQTFCHTLRGESINQGRLNHILTSEAHFAHLGGQSMAKAIKSTPSAKTSRPVTLKHLAATLAEGPSTNETGR